MQVYYLTGDYGHGPGRSVVILIDHASGPVFDAAVGGVTVTHAGPACNFQVQVDPVTTTVGTSGELIFNPYRVTVTAQPSNGLSAPASSSFMMNGTATAGSQGIPGYVEVCAKP